MAARERAETFPQPSPARFDRAAVLGWLLGVALAGVAALLWAAGLTSNPLATLLFLPIVAAGYTTSSLAGPALLVVAGTIHLALRAFDPHSGDTGIGPLLAVETWGPLLVFAAAAAVGEAQRRASSERDRLVAENRAARREAEARAAEAGRLARSLAAVASGLQSSFEPDRTLRRFNTLVRTLLGGDAALTLTIDESRHAFHVVEASGEGERALAELRMSKFIIPAPSAVEVTRLSFAAGDSGLLAPMMREHFGASVGFAAPILRGTQVVGLLLVGYRDATKVISDADRSLLAGSAALCSALFETLRLHRELRSSNRAKNEFTSTVSHELRTPLNAILGYCELLRDGAMGAISGEQADTLDRLRRHSLHLTELIESVLDVDRIEAGQSSMNWADCDLDTFYRELASSVPRHWLKPEVELRWRGTASRTVRTDADKLKLLLRNLVHNALKFTPAGTVTVEMIVTPGTLVFSITDTGIGIRPEVRQTLFQMFQPGDRSNTQPYGGLGVGLYLVDRMVKDLWGQISVDSAPGLGTTVRVILPIEEPVVEARASNAA